MNNSTTQSTRRASSRILATVAVAALASAAFASCGDDDEPDAAVTVTAASSTTAEATTTTAAAATTDAATTTEATTTTEAPATTEAETTVPETTTTEDTVDEEDATAGTVGDGAAPSGTADPACEPYLGVTTAFNAEAPDMAAVTTWLDELEASPPADVEDDLLVMTAAARLVIEQEDFSAFETPEFSQAQSVVDPWMFDNCSFDSRLEVTAADFRFEGIPGEVPSGQVGILLTNAGAESHELGLLRRNEGVTESFEEILALGEEEGMTKATFVGGAFAPTTGSQGLAIVDLEPGDYAAVCFIPFGTKIAEGVEGNGPPHFTGGMLYEFTVTE